MHTIVKNLPRSPKWPQTYLYSLWTRCIAIHWGWGNCCQRFFSLVSPWTAISRSSPLLSLPRSFYVLVWSVGSVVWFHHYFMSEERWKLKKFTLSSFMNLWFVYVMLFLAYASYLWGFPRHLATYYNEGAVVFLKISSRFMPLKSLHSVLLLWI